MCCEAASYCSLHKDPGEIVRLAVRLAAGTQPAAKVSSIGGAAVQNRRQIQKGRGLHRALSVFRMDQKITRLPSWQRLQRHQPSQQRSWQRLQPWLRLQQRQQQRQQPEQQP